ncbi:glycosyltransferase [Novosphingobium pituita]|uniref:Glycosyl transferase family 1 domain-containing protein n=1 Tax=Novosphingobium pituita TaxID=3056842 RepID=A0ABQ6P9G9_9SPHN|nr:glycosyltransferase [Novosphingobium sp. IK01]GMM61923.1 hypothetical protein NUTIK01_27000 [Novosphingobium sp. IK01]
MNILILGINYAPEMVGIGPYTAGTAQFLAQAGHSVTVVASKPYYPQWKGAKEYRTPGVLRTEKARGRVHRVPLYVPNKSSGLRRLIHHACFTTLAVPEMLRAAHFKKLLIGAEGGRTVEFSNLVNIDHIRPLPGPSVYREHWGITTPHVVLYSGNFGHKQGLEIIPQAARMLADRDDLTFVICGNGALKDRREAEASGLSNVKFFDLQSADKLNEFLGLATGHLLPQIVNTAYLVLLSKVASMRASGGPVLAIAVLGTGGAHELDGCGCCVPPGAAAVLPRSLVALLDDEHTRDGYRKIARVKAERRWGRNQILAKLATEMAGKFASPVSLHGRQAD